MKFGDKLLQLRKKKGLSQEELGEQLDVTRQTISKSNIDTDFDNIKPRKWLLVLLAIIAIIIVIVLANKIITDRKSNKGNGIFNIFQTVPTEINKQSFNGKFEIYTGTQFGASITILFDEIITNNKKNSDNKIEVIFDNRTTSEPNKIKEMKKKIQTLNNYEVSADYNEKGYINKITIETSENNLIDNFNKMTTSSSFNSSFELLNGTSFGGMIKSKLDDVIASNKKNPDHLITIIFGSTNTTNENEIRNLKKSINDFNQYEVIVDYDEAGYINKITIEN